MKISILLLLVSLGVSLNAQQLQGTIRGRSPDGVISPIVGAKISWKHTTLGTLSTAGGHFVLDRPVGEHEVDTLIISAYGYRGDTLIVLRTAQTLEVLLEAEYVARPVEVETERTAVSPAEPIRTELITSRQLEQSACCTLAESFERSPSVEGQFSDAALGAKTIRLLGLRGIYTSGLVEAVSLLHGITGAFALDDIPGPFLNGISISKGAASVLNGYGGITGMTNVDFKQPHRDVPFFVNALANHLGRAELNLTSAQHPQDNLHTMLMVHGRMFQRDVDANGDGFLDMPRFRNANAVGRVLWQDGSREMQLFLRPTWGNYKGGTFGAWINGPSGYRIETTTQRLDSYAKIAFNDPGINIADRLGIQLAFTDQRFTLRAGSRRLDAWQRMVQAKVIAKRELNDAVGIIYGISAYTDTPHEQLDSIVRSRDERAVGVFAEATLTPTADVCITVGARNDWHNMFGSLLTPRMNVKYAISELAAVRFSAGTGLRVPYMVADNAALFISNRTVVLDSVLLPERAVNVGGGITVTVPFWSQAITFDAEFYHTRFTRQLVTDLDRSARLAAIGYANRGYANSALVQVSGTILPNVELTVAYRLMDTYAETGGSLRLQPLVSPHRVLIAASYRTSDRIWEVNPLIVWYSSGRIPTTAENPEPYRFPEQFSSYVRASLHVNYCPLEQPWELYAGIENIANVLQRQAVIAADNPALSYFDASLIWGPLDQRTFYAGVRLRLGEAFE